MLFFYESQATNNNINSYNLNNQINDMLESLLQSGPYAMFNNVVYSRIDSSNPTWNVLTSAVGLVASPSVLLMVNGKGMWITGYNVGLLMERVEEFLPDYVQAS